MMALRLACRPVCRPALGLVLARAASTTSTVDAVGMLPTTRQLAEGVLSGDRLSLARAITLVESTRADHGRQAELLVGEVLARRQDRKASLALRLGFAGPPGAGKSTFIESLGAEFVQAGHRVAVLAVGESWGQVDCAPSLPA
jgi:hypothetical protein